MQTLDPSNKTNTCNNGMFLVSPQSLNLYVDALLTQATKPSCQCRTTSAGGTSWNFPANLGVWTAGHVCVLHITIAWIGISAGGFLMFFAGKKLGSKCQVGPTTGWSF